MPSAQYAQILRPAMLCFEPAVLALSIWISLAWGTLYLFLESLPLALKGEYHFSMGASGLAFGGLAAGAAIGLALTPLQEKLYRYACSRRGVRDWPEGRLLSALIGGWLFPAGGRPLACSSILTDGQASCGMDGLPKHHTTGLCHSWERPVS
jgi:hypothetical protein